MDLDTLQLSWDNMRRGIDAQAQLMADAPEQLYERARRVLPSSAPSRLYLIGCGDSHYCGLAARYAIEAWSGRTAEALESLEFSRYAVRTAPKDALVLGVSNSGEVSRSVEALRFARSRGLPTVAITYKPDSRLAQAADDVLRYEYADTGFGPGTISYLASMLALLVAGLAVGELTGAGDETTSQAELARLAELSTAMKATVDACEAPATTLSAQLSLETRVFFVGGGPNLGTAHYAMAKMIEACGHNSVPQELEEWAHEQYFCCTPGSVTMIFAPPGAGLDRAREQLRAVRDVGGTAVAVCAAKDVETAALADLVFPVAGPSDELLSPLLYAVPAQLLAYTLAVRTGVTMLGFDDEHRRAVNMRQILRSVIPDGIPSLGGR